MPKKRVLYYDVLRIVAVIGVIVIHCTSENFNYIGQEADWHILNLYVSFVRYAVPVFVMLTGALFGDPEKELSVKTLWKKNIFRLVTAYLAWNLFYVFADSVSRTNFLEAFPDNIQAMLSTLFVCKYHLWYMNMILCIYVLIPLLRLIARSPKALRYAIRLGVIFSFLVPTILDFKFFHEQPHLNLIMAVIRNKFYLDTAYHLNYEYIVYFLVGSYLSGIAVDKTNVKKYLLLWIGGYLFTLVYSAAYTVHSGNPYFLHNENSLNVFVESVGIFMVVKYLVEKHEFGARSIKYITFLSDSCFGIYLVHLFFLELMTKYGFTALSFSPLFAVPCKALAVFAASFIVSAALHRIPLLNKYIV